jgi:histidinol-phosphate aminotransferase
MSILPNAHLRTIQRDDERMHERAGLVRLDRNERVTPFADDEFQAMLATLRPQAFCAYPDPSPLYDRLARDLGIPADRLYLTNGSDAAIRKVFQAFVAPADRVLFTEPTYAMYDVYSQMFQADRQTVAYDDHRRLPVARLFDGLSRAPRLLALANPDQPTGAVLAAPLIRDIAIAAEPQGTLFLIDEAYYPFYAETAMALTQEFSHVIVTRTFSKVGGLAGLRLGYLAASPEIIAGIKKVRGAHEVNAVAIAMGCFLLDHPAVAVRHLADIASGRQVLATASAELGVGLPHCPTNFQLLELPDRFEPAAVVARLKNLGYLVRGGFSAPAVRRCLRVTLGGPDVMAGFAAALRTALVV